MAESLRVAALGDIPENDMIRVRTEAGWVALYNVDGTIYATDDNCSHATASLSRGSLKGCVVECPLHGATFDVRTGRNLTFPAVVPIKSYPVKVEGGEVFIER
jgi:3-phenylpropionate/trans-cinnamate dioxygenase ferredoxin subunit